MPLPAPQPIAKPLEKAHCVVLLVVEDVVDRDDPHTASMANLEGQTGAHTLVGDAPVPHAVVAIGSEFVAGTIVMGAWCAAVTSPHDLNQVPRVGLKCMKGCMVVMGAQEEQQLVAVIQDMSCYTSNDCVLSVMHIIKLITRWSAYTA